MRAGYIYDISPSFSQNEKYFGQICRENEKTYCMLNDSRKSPRFLDNVEKYDTARQATHENIMPRSKDALCMPAKQGQDYSH
jgi:hypothetical protein